MAKTKKKDSQIAKTRGSEKSGAGAKTSGRKPAKEQTPKPHLRKTRTGQKKQYYSTEAWISLPTAAIIITVVSLGVAVLTAWRSIPIRGTVEGILWGLVFGGSIWVIFIGAFWLNRFLRR